MLLTTDQHCLLEHNYSTYHGFIAYDNLKWMQTLDYCLRGRGNFVWLLHDLEQQFT